MLFAVIKGPSKKDVTRQIEKALTFGAFLELRLDFLEKVDIGFLREKYKVPMIFTVKGRDFSKEDILRLLEYNPEYLDIESDNEESFIKEIFSKCKKTKLILSHHDFEKTPDDLDALYSHLKRLPAHLYKIAMFANTTLDALRLISLIKSKKDLIVVSMGSLGQITRILAPVIGSYLTYASLDEGEFGQLSVEELKERYHYFSLSKKSKVYGLIGDPVEQSVSHITHNRFFKESGIDAVYVKLIVKKEELPEFLKEAKGLFSGLSVTMPLKEAVMEHLEEIDKEAFAIGAVNTLVSKEGSFKGYNTDGIGALTALEEKGPVLGKKMTIIGTGGAAKAIAFEAKKRGAILTILSRSESKAKALLKKLKSLNPPSKESDILVNCTPIDRPEVTISKGIILMDIKIKESSFILEGKERGCEIVTGYAMFEKQAMGQFDLWFSPRKALLLF